MPKLVKIVVNLEKRAERPGDACLEIEVTTDHGRHVRREIVPNDHFVSVFDRLWAKIGKSLKEQISKDPDGGL